MCNTIINAILKLLASSFQLTPAQEIRHWIANLFPFSPRPVRLGSKNSLVLPYNEYLDLKHDNSPSVTASDLDMDLKNGFVSENE